MVLACRFEASLSPCFPLPPPVASHPRLPSLFATLCKVFCTRMRARPHGNPRRVSLVARPWACNVTRVQVLARVIQRHLNSSGYIVTLVLFFLFHFFSLFSSFFLFFRSIAWVSTAILSPFDTQRNQQSAHEHGYWKGGQGKFKSKFDF